MSTPAPDGARGWLRLLQLTAFVSTLDRFAMPPMLVSIAVDLQVPLAQVVQAAGAYFLAYGVMQPVWGMVSDRIGLVRTLRLALLLSAVGTTASALAGSVTALVVSRALAGACFSAAIPGALIYVGDTVPHSRRQRDVTDLMAGVAVGTALAAVGAGTVAQHLGWQAVFVATGLSALVLVFALARLAEPPLRRTHRGLLAPFGDVLRSGPARLVLGLALAEGVVLLGALTLLPAAVESTGATASLAGAVTAVYGVAVLGFARAVGALSRSVHPWLLIAGGATAAFAACGLAAYSTRPAMAAVVAALLGAAWASMHSSLQTWATEVAPDARATAIAMFAGSLFLGSAVSAVLVGGLVEDGRYRTIFVLTAVAALPLGVAGAWGRARWQAPGGLSA